MKHLVSTFVLSLGLFVLAPMAALAQDVLAPSSGGVQGVPELDPSAANIALALIAGGAAVLNGRRRQRS